MCALLIGGKEIYGVEIRAADARDKKCAAREERRHFRREYPAILDITLSDSLIVRNRVNFH